MGSYSYKYLCYSIPQSYVDSFKEKYGREFDCDANYDGDYWVIAADYVADLESKVKELESKLNSQIPIN